MPNLTTTGPDALVESARAYMAANRSENTRRAYAGDWSAFASWCDSGGLGALPAEPGTVALYLTHMATSGRRASTIARALSAISQRHEQAGHQSPRAAIQVREVHRGIRRTVGTAQSRKSPATADVLATLVAALPGGLLGVRDRALLCLGFSTGCRRSELVALDAGDLEWVPEGLRVAVRRGKTDQEAAGRVVGVPFAGDPERCPVRALRAWLDAASISDGPVFRSLVRRRLGGRLSPAAVGEVVKRAAGAAGLDASAFGGHSLRAGLITSAARAGKSERAIMAQSGHRSVQVMRTYIRDADLFSENAAAGLF